MSCWSEGACALIQGVSLAGGSGRWREGGQMDVTPFLFVRERCLVNSVATPAPPTRTTNGVGVQMPVPTMGEHLQQGKPRSERHKENERISLLKGSNCTQTGPH
eukprot:evm.model.scf_170.2 EVM.evm.TU.scf_170.2   scf_170:32055-32366(-)